MTSGANTSNRLLVHPAVALNFAEPVRISLFAALSGLLYGDQPYFRRVTLDTGTRALDLVPPGFTVTATGIDDYIATVTAVATGSVLHINGRRDSAVVTITADREETVEEIEQWLRSQVPGLAPGYRRVRIWHNTRDRVASVRRLLQMPSWADIADNYPARVAASIAAALDRPDPSNGRLLLWHGEPGTGKTSAVRALIDAWSPWADPHLVADPDQLFTQPGYLDAVVTHEEPSHTPAPLDAAPGPRRSKLIVVEDADEYLRAQSVRRSELSMGRLLNLADGIVGQGVDVYLLLTSNVETGRLHPAITRPGRALSHITFARFDATEASHWLGHRVTTNHSLAELYALRSGRNLPSPTPSVGSYL